MNFLQERDTIAYALAAINGEDIDVIIYGWTGKRGYLAQAEQLMQLGVRYDPDKEL